MKHYEKYKKALEAHGYTVDVHGNVYDSRGNHAGGEDPYGNVYVNDPNITDIVRAAEVEMAKPKPKPKAKKKIETLEDGD